jgi:hypothetical protein
VLEVDAMLYISLVISLLLLLVINWRRRHTEHPSLMVIAKAGAFVIIPVLWIGALFPTVGLQVLLLTVTVLVWRLQGWTKGSFVSLSCGATVLAYGITGGIAAWNLVEMLHYFPYVSLDHRLPRKAAVLIGPLPSLAAKRLERMEEAIEDSFIFQGDGRYRRRALEQLHENTVQVFVNQPGFGVTRARSISKAVLMQGLRMRPTPPQPGVRQPPASLIASVDVQKIWEPVDTPQENVFQFHEKSVVDFVNPAGFGFVQDRQHVAGFQSHQFSQVPQTEHWQLQTLDLVGLLLHKTPVAYVSDNLPNMDELREAPIRVLDEFEAAGLTALQQGQDLFARAGTDGMRALGAVRSTKHCLSCHGGQRGDLLGAFSYTFIHDKR